MLLCLLQHFQDTCLPTYLDPLGSHGVLRPRAQGKLHDHMENTKNDVEFHCCGNGSSNQIYGTSAGGKPLVAEDGQSSVLGHSKGMRHERPRAALRVSLPFLLTFNYELSLLQLSHNIIIDCT